MGYEENNMDYKTVDRLKFLYETAAVLEESITKLLKFKPSYDIINVAINSVAGSYDVVYKPTAIETRLTHRNPVAIQEGHGLSQAARYDISTAVHAAIVTGQLVQYRLLLKQIRDLGGEITDAFENMAPGKPREPLWAVIAHEPANSTNIRVHGPYASREEADSSDLIGTLIKMTPPET